MNNTSASSKGHRGSPSAASASSSKRHRRSPSASSAASYSSVATFSHETDDFLKLRPHGESPYQTLEYICNNPRDGWIFKFASMTHLQLHEVRGRNKGCGDVNRETIAERGIHETQLANEIANTSNIVDELTERHLDVQNQLLEATANLYSLKKSKEEAVAAIDKARSDNKVLDLQAELAGKILSASSTHPKPFGGADVTLNAVGKVMRLQSFSDIEGLNPNKTHMCIRILNNFGLLTNPHFRELWVKNTPEEQREWESRHRKQPYIQTGKVDEDVMKLRLANYLDIAIPDYESGDESNDDPSIPASVGFALDSIPEDVLEKEFARRRKSA